MHLKSCAVIVFRRDQSENRLHDQVKQLTRYIGEISSDQLNVSAWAAKWICAQGCWAQIIGSINANLCREATYSLQSNDEIEQPVTLE